MYNTLRLRHAFKIQCQKCDCRVIMLTHTKQMLRSVADFSTLRLFVVVAVVRLISCLSLLNAKCHCDGAQQFISHQLFGQHQQNLWFCTIAINLLAIDSVKHTSKQQLAMFSHWTFVQLYYFHRSFSYRDFYTDYQILQSEFFFFCICFVSLFKFSIQKWEESE